MADQAKSTSHFRLDINGLRAWAVMVVMLYHFGVAGFSGGFVGVDVFFVISGFLMTTIVVGGLETSSGFSIFAFYLARAWRIFPALIVLSMVLLVLGWWFLTMAEYKPLSKQIITSLTFLSNIAFWREDGYFDSAGREKWLLHTWSLSVEWQFYLLLPVLLKVIWSLYPSRTLIAAVLLIGFLLSFAFSIYITPLQATAAFYLLPTRIWEMVAGGLIYLFSRNISFLKSQQLILEITGFALIIFSVVYFDSSLNWPGWLASIPVFGTLLILLSARSCSLLSGNIIAQWLGSRSYSIYLWHWPIVVALAFAGLQNSSLWIFIGVLFSLVSGHFSYIWLETQCRQKFGKSKVGLPTAVLLAASLIVILLAVGVYFNKGVAGRFSADIELISAEQNNRNPRSTQCVAHGDMESPACTYGGSMLQAILIGDSHANAVATALTDALPTKAGGIVEWTYTACPTIAGVKLASGIGHCDKFVDWVIKESQTVAKEIPLIIVNRTTFFAAGLPDIYHGAAITPKPFVYFSKPYSAATPDSLQEFSQRLVDTACLLAEDHSVYLMRPIPEMPVDIPKAMARARIEGNIADDISISLDNYHKRHDFIWRAQDIARDRCAIKILDPLPYLCSDGQCRASRGGRPLYYDDNHLSEYGNKLLIPMFAEIFK